MNNQIVLILIMFIIGQLLSIVVNMEKTSKKGSIGFYVRKLEAAKKIEESDSAYFMIALVVICIRLYFIYLAVSAVASFIK